MTLTPPLKWHGGKHYLASKIVAMMPPHTHYVEPYFGGGAVLLAKNPEGASEVVNDIDGYLTNFWHCIANDACFEKFLRCVQAIPFSEREYAEAEDDYNFRYCSVPMIDNAVKFFVRCRQSLAGRMKSFAPLSRTRTRGGMNEQVSAWLGAVDGLPAVHARLSRVAILNRPAVHVIKSMDGPDTLFYLDPPYPSDTRTAKTVYKHEMDMPAHASLVKAVLSIQGKVMISGYSCPLYDDGLRGWKTYGFDLPNNAASGASKRRMTERVWTNF